MEARSLARKQSPHGSVVQAEGEERGTDSRVVPRQLIASGSERFEIEFNQDCGNQKL